MTGGDPAEVTERFLAAFSSADFEAMRSMLAEDVVAYVTNADGDADVVWKWLDAHGAKFGLYRPIPGPDPAHVQSRGDWHKLASNLREGRLRTAEAAVTAERQAPAAKRKVAKASW